MKGLGFHSGRILKGLGLLAILATAAQPAFPGIIWPSGDGVAWAEEDGPSGRDILVFVDESGSTNRQFDVYRRALLHRIVPDLKGGDRIRVAPIVADNSLVSEFMAEGTMPGTPVFDSLSDNEIEYKQTIKKDKIKNEEIRNQLLDTLKSKLAKSGHAKYTDIFGAVRMASQMFSAVRRRPILVLLSDMQEDRGRFRYRTMTWDKKEIGRVEKAYGFPDLKDVCVYVIGTRSPSIEKTRKMTEFWMMYFKKSGADISPMQMGSMMVNWPPPSNCGKPKFKAIAHKSWLQKLRKSL